MINELMLKKAALMGIQITDEQADKFACYHKMLVEANRRMNLTRVSASPEEAADRNYLDSIAVLAEDFPMIESLIDVGTGAGLPGIPLSIMLPDVRVVLLDSLAKRVNFLAEVIRELDLNAEAVHMRAEDAAGDKAYREKFDLAVSRGVARLNILCEYMLPFVKQNGYMLALKGPAVEDEMDEGSRAAKILGAKVEKSVSLPIPGQDWDHRGVWLKKYEPTPKKYPRSPGNIKKTPLGCHDASIDASRC